MIEQSDFSRMIAALSARIDQDLGASSGTVVLAREDTSAALIVETTAPNLRQTTEEWG